MKEQGDIWVVAKTLKAFNRLRVAWEEDYGTVSIPVEPPPARWADCNETDWVSSFCFSLFFLSPSFFLLFFCSLSHTRTVDCKSLEDEKLKGIN